MSKETVFSLIRTLLMFCGAFLIGHNLFGQFIDSSMLEEILGSVMAIIGLIWSIVDKTSTIEALQSTLMNVMKFFGGLLVASGKISGETLVHVMGFVAVLAPMLYQYLSKKKTKGLANGTIELHTLKGGIPVQKQAA